MDQAQDNRASTADPGAEPLTLDEYTDFLREIEEQPKWKDRANREMDYADGNQLNSELLARMKEAGIPPGIEDQIGPAMRALQGYEAATRTDWRVTPNGGSGGQDVADAINYRINEAERMSRADRACSDAFRSQAGVGLGWVEVSRNADPFKYRYRSTAIHRNEIQFDWSSRESDLSDARYLIRQRWMQPRRIADAFPEHREAILSCGKHGGEWWITAPGMIDGTGSTGLQNVWNDGRGWTVSEDHWYNAQNKELCLSEVWYRRWATTMLLKMQDGRIVEFQQDNPAHALAISKRLARVINANVSKVRRSYWVGPLCVFDGPTPYAHPHFPYVPFWGFREDTTRVPYGYIRSMIYQQDALNSAISKARWGLSVTRVERTKGAVAMSDDQLRRTVARSDADIVLDQAHMAKPGARFDVHRDYQLTDQHYQLMQDARAAIERVSVITSGFQGKRGTATSGVQEQAQIEQSNQSIQAMMDSFRDSRRQVGELLMAMIVEDIGAEEHTVIIEGDAISEERTITLNQQDSDPETGLPILSNDLSRTRLLVSLEEVPSSTSFRAQQLSALSESIKALPANYQAAAMPFLVSLMDLPFKGDLVEAFKSASEQQSPEQIEQRIKQATDDALIKSGNALKERELGIKERLTDAQIKQLLAQAVQTGVQAAYSAMQAGAQVAQMPQIAPVADAVMQGAGYRKPSPDGDDPNFPAPQAPASGAAGPRPHRNTSPAFPPVPDSPGTGMSGIETPQIGDDLPS